MFCYKWWNLILNMGNVFKAEHKANKDYIERNIMQSYSSNF